MTGQTETYYTVQTGDTFHSLAQLYYRDRNKWTLIRQANPKVGHFGPDQALSAGLQLTLPFLPEFSTTILSAEGDTLNALATFYYFSADKWMTIRQANPPLQAFGEDQPLPVGIQITLPFIPDRMIIVITIEGDTYQSLAKTYYDDENQWLLISRANTAWDFKLDQPLPVGLQLTLPFLPELTTAIFTAEGDTFHTLASIYYNGNENQWVRIRQANSALQDTGADQALPVGSLLTLPSYMPLTFIITENGDTLRGLSLTYQHNDWVRIRQINPALQGFSPDEPLPVGFKLALLGIIINFRSIMIGNNTTFESLARQFYQNANKWPVIRQANPPLWRYGANQVLPSGISVTVP